MYIQLMHRSCGISTPIKYIEIPCDFNNVYIGEDNINEELLLNSIPEKWLPCKPSNILITVSNKTGSCFTGQRGLEIFRSFAKYFDSYVLELHESKNSL